MSSHIKGVHARQIFDSRGRPTVEVDVELDDGTIGRASVPSGASTGSAEVHELRDASLPAYGGLGVRGAVANVNNEISAALRGMDALDQRGVDNRLISLDGTPQLRRLGGNAVLGASLAVSRAAAAASKLPLYQHIAQLAGVSTPCMPVPMVNILSGGLHAGRGMDVQDFLAVPASAQSMEEALEVIGRVRSAATEVMAGRGLTTLLADEGGLSPGLRTGQEALSLLMEATEHAGLRPGADIVVAIDVAATSLYDRSSGTYRLAREGRSATAQQMIEMVASWVKEFPVVSVEDPLDEEDWDGWQEITRQLGSKVRLVGDDFFTTNGERVRRGIERGCANGVLVKVNQNGTLSGTLDVISLARNSSYAPVVSARSGETEDSFIADLAVGSAAGQIKIGSLRCSDRLSKYNQLLRIEEASGLPYAGMGAVLVGR